MSTNRLWQKTFVMLALVVGCSILVEPFPPRSAVRAAPNPAPRAITDAIVAPADDASSPRLTPAILHGGVPVTISVNPPRAPAGQTITVSGQGAPNFGQVRLAVVRDGKMFGIQDVNADRAGTYTTNLPIDGTYPPGPVQLCAFALGLDKAIVACADLVVEQAPNGSLVGQFPLDMAQQVGRLNAEVRLLDAAGSVRYSTALRPDGSFSLPSIAPGAYSYAVVGLVPKLVEMGTTQIEPLKENVLTWAIQQPICTFAEQRKPTTALAVNPSRVEFVHKSRNNGLFRSYVDEPRPFGLYVSGVRNLVTFTAAPQSTAPVQKIIFEFNGVNNQRIERLEVTAAPFAIQFDVGRLPPSRGGRHPFVTVTPVVDGKEQCPSLYDIEVAADPMASPFMQPQNSRTTWDDGAGVYRFEGIVPYVEGLLPAEQTLADVPLLGPIRNKFNAGLAFKGSFDLEGKASLVMAEVRTEAAFLSIPLPIPNNGRVDVTPPGMQQVVFDIHDPSRISIPYGPLTLFQKDLLSIPFAKIPVFTFFGIFNVYVGGGINFGVGLYLEGVVRPLAPALDTTLTGTGRLGLEIGISADLVLGLVEGGAALGGEMCANVPLQITLSNPPNVDFNDPYIGGRLYLAYWASAFWGLVKTRGTTTLVDFGRGCPGRQITRQAAESALVTPSVLASPAVAASPSGRVLSAYVANTAAAGATPQVQIIARFQDPNTGAWSEPQALSNPAHSAQSPTVAFVGGNQTPMVAWTENTMTAAEAAAIGDNDNKKDAAQHIRQQEIFYSLWSDIGWSTPIALTNDKLGDGMAAAAGGQRTGVIAWTRDTDGDATTRTDQRIMVSLYNPKTQRFDAPTLLGNNQSGLNASVSVALNPYDIPIAAWVNDADGDLTTAEDRRLQVVSCCVRGDWVSLNPQPLPPRVDSPTVSAGLDGIRVAFLVREASKDGEVALLGPNGVLWLALYDVNNRWTVHPVRDADGQLVYAEQPVLQSNQNEALLLFRRFGQTNATSAFGQLGLSQMQGGAAPSPPIYLTDGPKQQWLPALAINPINAKAIVLHSSLPRSSAAVRAQTLKTLAATQALPRAQDHTLIGGDAPVESLTVENKGDPALDPLQVSRMSPMPGATIAVTTTVRNVGRGTASGLRVELYRGSVVGVPVAMHNLSKALSFNETATVTFSIVVPADLAPSGQLPLVARLVTSDDNLNTNNDYTTITIGRLSAPSRVELVGENAEWSGALDLTWSGNTGEYVTGYRVYRRASATERWAFVGESAVPSFTDTTVEKGTRYCYTVQAYNGQGALSPYGAETCAVFQVALSVQGIFLPLIWR